MKSTIDTSVPVVERFNWPKRFSPLSPEQERISDDFVRYWHEVLPKRYGIIEKFNHTYSLRHLPSLPSWRTLELGAGIGGHLGYEPLERQEYHCMELRPAMAEQIRKHYPSVNVVAGDCQQHIPYEDNFFDRVVMIHVLEHLPDLPACLAEVQRVLKPGGVFSAVIPCDPGLLYEFARKISAERIFKARYRIPYRWFARREHINSPAEILSLIKPLLEIFDTTYFPTGIPLKDLNLCVGLTARKRSTV